MRETASVRRQAPRNVASSLDSARELGIRDAQAALVRQRSERLERPNAHLYETGGRRRTHLRGHANILSGTSPLLSPQALIRWLCSSWSP